MSTFQELITKLFDFWAKKGCMIHQGHDVEVGAGTFNPATFLRSLGPEPYNTVYVEPSRRPQDARYGENPNRVHIFHQMQVLLKPSPVDIQKLYLESLEAVGFDLTKHDVRFVHDDWESPTLGAWGLGWEVWIDGMEITQFTYFQQVGGAPLDPIPVEITYGLERLCMIIQNVDDFFSMKYNDTVTYGEAFHRNEVEWSHYNFEEATTSMWLRHFDDFEKEAKQLVEKKLPLPAYDFVMKASHAFNLLEARGVLSVTERTGYIAKIRDLSALCAKSYKETRKELGYPLLKEKKEKTEKAKEPLKDISFDPQGVKDFLFEIYSEELPALFIKPGMQGLERAFTKLLKDYGLGFESIKAYGTPKRLSVLVKSLKEGTHDTNIERKGPPVSTCFAEDGTLTKQGQGFLKSLGIEKTTLKDIQEGSALNLFVKKIKETEYLFAEKLEKGISTLKLLAEKIPDLVKNLYFPKKMRWSDIEFSYARPIHNFLAIFGEEIIPFEIAEVSSTNYTFGHSQLSNKKLTVSSPDKYVSLLRENKVLIDQTERYETIIKQLDALEIENKAKVLEKGRVLSQVLFLSEYPMLCTGSFEQHFLQVPREVLTSEMIEHQRYFPLEESGRLINKFIITADNTPNQTIISGNEKVLSARLADGVFLYKEDLEKPLQAFNEKLKTITFQKELGSMFDKVKRIEKHAKFLHDETQLANEDQLLRAALLCKADLATLLVGEFPELQGIIGKHYAMHHHETKLVATCIEEHWLPRFEADKLPELKESILLSLSDKLDNILSYFSVGLKPSSSSDPYALRRQTLGVLRILIENKLSLELSDILEGLATHFKTKVEKEVVGEILQFARARLKTIFEEIGFKKDEIEASLTKKTLNPYDLYLRLQALEKFRKTDEFNKLYEVYKRAKGQLSEKISADFSESLLEERAEKDLYAHLASIKKNLFYSFDQCDYENSIKILATLQKPLASLFDEVKILCDNVEVRANRLALLQGVFDLFSELLDFSKIQQK
ncbi:MAG: hypothetical protein S4CHLAM37_09500 [Chlamydiia bacterium]|nr:hypothetical protein [Chlamydiia bacterium]